MIVETKEFKQLCSKILYALDNSSVDTNITDNLEIISDTSGVLYLNVTNKEYYVSTIFYTNNKDTIHATVNASTFLKLISQITTNNIEFNIDGNTLNIKGNGKYKLPLIFDNDKLLELPKIEIYNKTLHVDIDKTILDSIINYNSKEIIKENITKPIQKMYYLDDKGCITFTGTGACVNEFTLSKPFKILLNSKIVKLFKIFKPNAQISFYLGYDYISDSILQTKVSFDDGDSKITAILSCDDSLLNSVPVNPIRSKINFNYPYSIVIDKNILSQSLSRLMVFNKNNNNILYNYYNFNFRPNELIISDSNNSNIEVISYQNNNIVSEYSTMLNVNEFKYILDGCSDQYITILFGAQNSILVVRNNIKNILMEYNKE